MTALTSLAVADIVLERDRQDEQWGVQRHPFTRWFTILGEEVGEVGRAILDQGLGDLRTELIQVAAVAVAIVEQIDEISDPDSIIAFPEVGDPAATA